MRKEFIVISYDIREYPFQQILAKQVFKVPQLSQLHTVWKKQTNKTKLDYQDNLALRNVMQRLPDNSLFYKVYHRWIVKVLAPHYGNKISYSAHPKMRVHLAGTKSVSNFHIDSQVTKRLDQINCYLPFTNVFEGATLWCEVDYGTEKYEPLNLEYGQALLWDGGCLKHGTYANDTTNTRVSCDFRFSYKKPEIVTAPWNQILSSRTRKVDI